MININIKLNSFWKEYKNEKVIFFLKGYIYSHKIEEITNILEDITQDEIEKFLYSLNGHFSIIVKKDNFSFIAVDKVRSTPLFFTQLEDIFYIDYNPKNLVSKVGFNKQVRNDASLEISMSGFTIGNKTLYKNLYSLKAGEFVIFENNNYKYIQYYKYFGEIQDKIYMEYINELYEVTLNIFRKMLKEIGKRQIIIPLSAGNDSRLVVSALKHLGAENVKCYSYGKEGNFEAKIAKLIAKKLGYEWIFVPLTHKSENNYFNSSEYKDYCDFSETYCSIPYIQSISSMAYLKNINWIDDDAVFINGSTGDFISGSHINSLMKNHSDDMTIQERKNNILNSLVKKHFSLWGYLKTDENVNKIKKSLFNEVTYACGNLDLIEKDHLFYEYLEFIDRQSKYIITGQRVYEYYNYEWRLPLWDDEYLYFWQKVPSKYKVNQKLYNDMLKEKNLGNVWGNDIPINRKTITPKWIIPIRFLLKIPFGLFGSKGKKSWKQFEINFLSYWTDVVHLYNIVPYWNIVVDFNKKPRNFASWLSKIYLKNIRR